MSFGIRVSGGTGAGRKKPLKPQPNPWVCGCGHVKPRYLAWCLGCKQKRPSN